MSFKENYEYLNSPEIQNDPWVRKMATARAPMELANLILARLADPGKNGPSLNFDMISEMSEDIDTEYDMEAQIIHDLVNYSSVDITLFEDAMTLIMDRVNSINPSTSLSLSFGVMENVLFLIESLVLCECYPALRDWVIERRDNVKDKEAKNIYQRGVDALSVSQPIDNPELKDFWLSIWDSEEQNMWETAAWGLFYSDVESFLETLPKILERKLFATQNLLYSLLQIDKNKGLKIDAFLAKGLKNNDVWAGKIINLAASSYKMEDAKKLVLRLNKAYTAATVN